jgi:hypothetical protein
VLFPFQKNIQFYKLLVLCKNIILKYKDQDKYPEYALYSSRYDRILSEIEQLKTALKNCKLATDFRVLEITHMVDRNDPDEMIQVTLKLNKFYLTYFKRGSS